MKVMLRFFLFAFGAVAAAQDHAHPRDLAAGKFLVAARNLSDPNFAESVVLLTRYDESGAMGLIVNRRAKVTVARLLEDLDAAASTPATSGDPLYVGGPVGLSGALALVRAESAPPGSRKVLEGMFLVSGRDNLRQKILSAAPASTFRIYLGYSGWGPGQLEREVQAGAWKILRADADQVFDANPESIWPRLIRRTEVRYAGAWFRRPAPSPWPSGSPAP